MVVVLVLESVLAAAAEQRRQGVQHAHREGRWVKREPVSSRAVEEQEGRRKVREPARVAEERRQEGLERESPQVEA